MNDTFAHNIISPDLNWVTQRDTLDLEKPNDQWNPQMYDIINGCD